MTLKRSLLIGALTVALGTSLGTSPALADTPTVVTTAPADKTKTPDEDAKHSPGSSDGSSRIGGMFGSSDLAEGLANVDSIITKLIGVIFVMTAVF